MDEKTRPHATFTPVRRPLTFDYADSTSQEQLVKAIQKRLTDSKRTSLTMRLDSEWLEGVAAIFPLRYARDILKLVLESDEVSFYLEVR